MGPRSGWEASARAALPFQKLKFPEVPLYLGVWGHLDPVEENLNTYRKLLLWGETCLPVPHPPSSSKTVGLGNSDSWGFDWDTTVF